MKRTGFVLALILALAVSPLAMRMMPQRSTQAADVKLKDILEKGLRAYKKSDFTYIAKVVNFVDTGKLTRGLVVGTFRYTRRKYGFKRYLVPYFQRVLTLRAAKIGVSI